MKSSLTVKLILAFLIVGLIGAGVVAVVVRWHTQRAFNRFVENRSQSILIQSLTEYFQAKQSWEGAEKAFQPAEFPSPQFQVPQQSGESQLTEPIQQPGGESRRELWILTDAAGLVVSGGGERFAGRKFNARILRDGQAIRVEGKAVGYLLFVPRLDRWRPGTAEGDFLTGFSQSVRWSALIAVLVALLTGVLMASRLTRSLRELTVATRALADGELGKQVEIHSKDELGELAQSFNQMSSELERSSTLRKQMSADIAHDLRNPLTVILGYSEALADGKLEPTSEMFDTLHTEAEHLSRLIDDFKTLSLADAGELPLSLQLVESGSLLQRTANFYSVRAEKQGVRLTTRIEPGTRQIFVDSERMMQVLGNLVSNALRYTPSGGEIGLSVQMEGSKVRIDINDSGTGISEADLPNIFERSYRSDRARSQNDGEAGLGLAIARSIVETLGGRIAAQSQVGKGSTFSIWFDPAK